MIDMKISSECMKAQVIGDVPTIANDFINGYAKIYESLKETGSEQAELFGSLGTLGTAMVSGIVSSEEFDKAVGNLFQTLSESDDEDEEDTDVNPVKFVDYVKRFTGE